ncbi:MAG: hypothetical protein NTV05_11385 [Acidobacteria bacterium]|nr:hypothetical protein [Acidobacteriota bacterium]
MATPHNIPIRIANLLIELTSPLSAVELGIEGRLGPFRAEEGALENPLSRVALRWEDSKNPPAPQGELIYDPGSIWKMYRAGSDFCATLAYENQGQSVPVQGLLRANRAWDDAILTEHRSGLGWQSLLNLGAGELIFRTAILSSGGLVLHSSGLDDNGKGIVFIGHSGAGKSTQVGLWSHEPGVVAMNDDRIAVRVEAGGPVCYGTPWGGTAEIARNHAAPLAALIVLEQASENAIQPLAPAAAAPLLMARAFLPYWDAALMQRAMANLNTILARVPVYRLRCRPEGAVISLVRSIL